MKEVLNRSNGSKKTFVLFLILVFSVNEGFWGDGPRRVDPDDTDVAEENTLFVLLVLTGAALLSPLGHVGGVWRVVLRCGTHGDTGG